MQVAVTARCRHGPVYGALLPDPPKYGWWRVAFAVFNSVHSLTVIPYLLFVSLPIEQFEQQEVWLITCIALYLTYTILCWIATIRCHYCLLHTLCYFTPVVVTFLFYYAGCKGNFVYKNSWKDQIVAAIMISAMIACTILRFIASIDERESNPKY